MNQSLWCSGAEGSCPIELWETHTSPHGLIGVMDSGHLVRSSIMSNKYAAVMCLRAAPWIQIQRLIQTKTLILYLTFYLQTLSHTRRHAAEQKSENATLNSIGASRNQQICQIGKVQIKRRPRVEVHGVVAHRCNSLNSLFSTKLAIFLHMFYITYKIWLHCLSFHQGVPET